MLRIGLTGGIGSGKSTVAKIFEVLGIPVYYADEEAKNLMNEDEKLRAKIIAEFGNEVYASGKLDRGYLSSIVFNNPAKLELLNSIVHPAIIAAADNWLQQQTTPYALKEAALIFESGAHEHLDKVIGVFAPKAIRINRVMKRDNATREEVMARLNKQLDETIKMKLCDYIITNNDQELLIPQVVALHQQLLALL
jgi:dephospho-CoA kinase